MFIVHEFGRMVPQKHSSLSQNKIGDEEKSFVTLTTGPNVLN
jgi:hypothetical protein